MSWRKWLVRLLVFGVLSGCTCAVLLYQRWTDPAAVRAQVVESLQRLFPGASVSLDSARLNVFGGIVLSELRLSRKDDPDAAEFLHVPSVVVYHDKEHLFDGKIAFRKVELLSPRLRLQRGRDGRWNVADLLAKTPPGPREPIPTLVVKQGTLVLDDRMAAPGTPVLEVADVNFTVINDPDPTVTFEGSGASAEVGSVRLHGSWQRDSGTVTLSLEAGGIPLTPLLVQRLAAHCPDKALAPFQLEGKVDIQARADYQPASDAPLSYEVRCQVHRTNIVHPSLPLPLEDLETSVVCADGLLTVESLTAKSGTATVELVKGAARLPRIVDDFEATVKVRHLPLTKKLIDGLPEGAHWLHSYFEPVGQASLEIQLACAAGGWLKHQYTLRPEGLRVCCETFRYPVAGLVGVVEYDYLKNLTRVDARGTAGGQPVTVRGTWKGSDRAADVKMEIVATGLKIDDKLIAALPGKELQDMAKSFNARGRCDTQTWILHTPGVEAYQNTYLVKFRDTQIKWSAFPCPLEGISGELHVLPDHWEFHDFRGTHHGGEVRIHGQTFPEAAADAGKGPRLLLFLTGRDIALDNDLETAFKLGEMPGLVRAWETFNPAGRLNVGARIDRLPGKDQDLDVTLDVHGCSLEPTFFRCALHDVCGQIRYYKDQILLSKVTARHKATRLSLGRGVVDLYGNGGFYADLADLAGNPVVPDKEFVAALPEGARSALTAVGLQDPFAFQTRLVIAQGADAGSLPDTYWDGWFRVQGAKLQLGADLEGVTGAVACRGRHNGRQLLGLIGNVELERATVFKQPFRNAYAHLHVKPATPDVLNVDLVSAPLFGGNVSGQARVEFHSDLRYELNLTAAQIRLEELSKHNLGGQAQLSGIGAARLHLTGKGEGMASLEGNGSIDVPYTGATRLYNLPLLLDLLKFLGLRWPDRTLFEEAHAVFSIHGNRASISRLDLFGNVVSLWGRGDINLDGTDIQLDFYPSWARIEGMLPPGVRAIPPAISKNLLKIEVRGKVSGNPKDVEFHKKPVPMLLDPILQMRDLVVGKKSAGN